MRQVCKLAEDQAIENMVYFDAILETGTISHLDLKQKVAEALRDPKRREEAHKMYSEMWEAADKAGAKAVFEDLLNNLPATEKPN